MEISKKTTLIDAICRQKELNGESLSKYRAELEKLSEAELSQILRGKEAANTSKAGVGLEHAYDNETDSVNTETFKTEIDGEIIDVEITYNIDGYPVKRTEYKNGETLKEIKYTWVPATNETPAHTIVQEENPDGSSRETIALSVTDSGEIKDEDFLYSVKYLQDGSEERVFSSNGMFREDKITSDGKTSTTIYSGASYNTYLKNGLHRLAQQVTHGNKIYYVEYDGKGNTITTVQNNESPTEIARTFGVKLETLMKMNPYKGKNGIDQVGAKIRVPGEFDADSKQLGNRLGPEESVALYKRYSYRQALDRVYTSSVGTKKLNKNYNGNYWELAKDLLGAGATNEAIRLKVQELEILNAGNNTKLSNGSVIYVTEQTTNKKVLKELSSYGFSAGQDNFGFYNKFNRLNASQKQNVISMLRYFKSQKITDKNKIKAEILKVYPDINLFDSEKTIPMNGTGSHSSVPASGMAFQPSREVVSLETFVTDYLGISLQSSDGQRIYERLNSMDQEALNKISAGHFVKQYAFSSPQLHLYKKDFAEVDRILNGYGITLKTADEIHQDRIRYKNSPEYEKAQTRENAARCVGLMYDQAIAMIREYQDSQGWLNIGFWREKLGGLLDLVIPDNDYVAPNHDAVIRRLERNRDFVVSVLKTNSTNSNEFNSKFKEFTGMDYDEAKVEKFLEIAKNRGNKSDEEYANDYLKAYTDAFGSKITDEQQRSINIVGLIDGTGDIAAMIIGTGWLSKTSAFKSAASGTANFVGKLGLGNTAAMNLTRGLVGAELLGGWTASTGTVNLMTRKAETTIKDWQDLGKTTLISAGFGFMGGITADKLAQLESYVSKQASRMAGKFTGKDKALITAQQAAVDENTAAMAKVLESGKGMNGVEVWGKYLKNLSGVNAAGNIAKFAAEIGIFTGYDISVEVISDLLDKDGKLKDIFQEPAKLEEFLTEKLKENTTNLGLIKTIGSFIQMRLGGKYGSALADYEVLQRTNVKQMEINGVKKYIIEIDNGNRIIADSPAQVAAFYRTALYAETLSKNGTEAGGQSSGAAKQQPGTSGSYEEVKPAMISLTSPELKSTPVQNNGNLYTPQDIKNNIETIGIRNINGRSNLIYLSEDANTAKYGINTLDDLLKSDLVTKEEKDLIKKLYAEAEKLGYKDLYDDNLHVLIGFASTAEEVNGKLVSKYDDLTKEQFEVIKYITDQCRRGEISDEHTAAILSRINDPIPYEVFKYINDPEKLPDEITRGQMSWSKEQCLEWIDEIKSMREFLNTQSIPADITVRRVDDYSVMDNINIGGKPLGQLMEEAAKNGKIDDVLKILNGDKSNIEVTFDNFIGTSMSKEETFVKHHDIKWEIDVPKGTKGAFLETAVTLNSIYDETEFLLQMGTTLKITGAEYKDGSWHIKAEVVRQNTPASNTAAAKNSKGQFPPTPLMDEAHGQKHGDNHLHKVYNTPKFQKEISSCLDALVEKIDHDFKPGKNLQHPVDYADYMMPDGTILSRNLLKDAKNGEILIYCIDTNGKQYYLCATTPENIAKAQKIYDYMSQLPEIPGRNYIKPLQEQIKAGKTFEEAMKIVEADMEKARIEANNRSEQALIANNAVKPSEYLVKPVNSPEFEGITLSAQEKIKAKVKHQDMNVLLQDKKLEALYKANAQPAIQLNVEAHLNHIYSRMSTELKPGETSVEVPYNTPVTLPDGTKIVRQKVTKLHPYYQRDGYETKYGLPNEPKEIISVTTPDGQTYTLPAVSIGSVNSAKRVLDLMGKAIAPKEQDYTPPKLPGADAAAEAKRVATIHKTIDNIKTKSTLITYLEQHSGFADGNKILTKENLTELLAPYNETNMQNLKEVLKYMYGESTNDSYTSERILDVLKSDFIKNPENADFIKQFLTEKSASVNDLIDVIIIDRTFTLAESDTAEAAKALFALKNKTNNPVLNVDNIILMTNNYKGKNAEYYNRLADILNIKDEQGSYVINAENFPISNPEAIDFLMKDNKLVHPDVLNLLNRNLAKAEAGNIDVKGLNIMNALYDKNPDISVNELVRKTKEFAVDKKITDPKLAEIGNKYLSPDLNTQLFDIQTIMADVKDERILEYVNKELDEIIAKHPEGRQLNDKINEIQNVLDIYHSVNSDYVNIGGGNYSPYYRQFINYLKKSNPDLANKLIKQPTLIEKYIMQPAYNSLREDFNNDMQFGQLINYCKDHPNSELSEYFYENYFLKNINLPQGVKQKCIELNNKYGVKVIPSANIKEAKEVFDYLDKEFTEWQTASNGQAKLPPVLDFLTSKRDYIDNTRAYGQGTAGGFAETYTSKSISLNNMTLESVQYSIRHELTHINDKKKSCPMPEGIAAQMKVLDPENGTTSTEIDFLNCKYRSEFLRAGIDPYHVKYAYNNADEFIAVAAEGDMSKYSPEFKKLLIDLGMPEYMFSMKVTNPDIIKKVKDAETLQNMYPDETLEGIYYSYEKDMPEPVTPEPVKEAEPAAIPAERNITYAGNGEKVPTEAVNNAVAEIRERYAGKEADIRKYLDEAGLGEIGNMKGRLKSEQSLYDKIANYMEEHPNATLDEAIKDVRDAFGARTVINTDYDYKNHPQVKALLDAGDERGAILKAAELQSQPALEKLKGMLLVQSQGKEGLETARISNYVSEDGIPYFSEAQLAELKQYGASIGVNVNYVVRLDESDPNYAKMKAEGLKPATKAQPSGYTALQVNFKTKTGETIEWQYRGDKVDRFAEGEHIPYDLRTGKNIIGEHKELEPLYNPIKELLSKDNMPEAAYNEYNRYLTDYYTHLRKLELGFESTEPKLADYGNGYKFDERLNAENLIALHEAADKLKNGKISQQEAINEYNTAVQKNTPKTSTQEAAPLSARIDKDNLTPEEFQNIKDDFIAKLKADLGNSVSHYTEQINKITDVEDLKALLDAYDFLKSNNIKVNIYGSVDFLDHITKENINDFKNRFTFLKENSKFEDSIITWVAIHAAPNSTECVKQLFNVLGNHPALENDDLGYMMYMNLTPESTAAKLDFYKTIENDPDACKTYVLSLLIDNVNEKNLDIARNVYNRYKNNEIKNISNIAYIIKIDEKRPLEFVEENLDLLIKYEQEAWRIGKNNIDIVKAAAERNLPAEDVTRLITLRRDNSQASDEILKLVKEGKSVQQIDFALYKNNVTAKVTEPLSYEPSLAYELDPNSRGLDTDNVQQTSNTYPLEGLNPVKKPLKTLNVPSMNEIMNDLYSGRTVRIEIPNEGGMKPTAGDSTIHPEDVSRLGKTEDAGFELCYGVKRNWSNSKIARDLMQNFFNGHSGTLEGVSLDIQRVDGKYKIRISGKGTYDYGYLDALGASSGDINPTSIGRQYGEGAKIAALSLLTKQGTDYVKFACGEWGMTFGRSSDDIDSAHMTQTLSQNKPPQEGNYVEFTTDSPEMVKQIIEAKDYFGHPYNKDFQNFDYENEYFGIKLLPEGEKGNIYVVQRYETSGGIEDSLNGFSIVFKKKPDDPELTAKTSDNFALNADRDRGQLSNYDITYLTKKYASTMTPDDLSKLISSLEPIWSKDISKLTEEENAIIRGLILAAGQKHINIDFLSKKYVYMDQRSSAEDFEMARIMGYKPVSLESLTAVGLKDFNLLTEKKKIPMTPDEVQSKKIQILNEGVRVIQELLPKGKENLISSREVDAPKFVFNKGGSPNERAEAIIGYGTYKGHWIKESALYTDKFVDLLATWLHEMSHKHGGDVSTEFTNALKDIETNIVKILTDNPEALAKIKYLAQMYDDVDSQMTAPKFDANSYAKQVRETLTKPSEYVEYREGANPDEIKISLPAGLSSGIKYETLPKKSGTSNNGNIPTTSELMSTLNTKGSVEVAIPDAGGLHPTNSENPVIHPEDVSKLGVTEKAKIKVRYAEATNWSNFKIARDLMQNFYDGNGHTLEGVTIKVDKTPDGYKVRVEGLGNYDYKHLQRIGSSTKPYLVEDLGNFGEGTRIIASSLLAKGSDSVKYGCGEWQLEFGRQQGRLSGDDVVQTLTQNPQPVNGNYMEFTTKDASMVEELLNAKDYFYHPYNENFQNLEFENEFFGFKHIDSSEESTIYLGQKYEINKDFKDSPQKLCIIFKKLPNYPDLKKLDYYQEYRLSTGCDRVGLDEDDVQSLARRYAKSMTDEELLQSVASLEDIWTTSNPKDDMIVNPWSTHSLEFTFVKGLMQEVHSRNLQISNNPKIVGLTSSTPTEQIEYFQKEGYRFTPGYMSFSNILNADELYAQTHKLHSVEPTETETKKLQLIQMAAKIFTENDSYGVMPRNIDSTTSYVFNSAESNCPTVHAKIEDGEYKGLFIDRNALKYADFMTLVQESICQMLHTAGNDKSANYSYELTDLLRTQVDQFIKDPTVARRLRILQIMYDNLGD